MTRSDIYLGTVLLEANRWAAQRTPTYKVSEWLARFAGAGFDGIELWENHATLADTGELSALRNSQLPVAVFNSYATLDEAGTPARAAAALLAWDLKAHAIKFNVGKDVSQLANELEELRHWRTQMPGVCLLCECHAGTSLEDPVVAAAALRDFPEVNVIVHPFSTAELPAWLEHFGSRVRHAHVQIADANWRRWRLSDQSELVRERLAILRDASFAGSFTIEFTAGVGVAPEDREALFAAACDDLAFLRQQWTGGAQ